MYDCNVVCAATGGRPSQTYWVRRSTGTSLFASMSSVARTARCFGAVIGIGAPEAAASRLPRIAKYTTFLPQIIEQSEHLVRDHVGHPWPPNDPRHGKTNRKRWRDAGAALARTWHRHRL